MNDRLLRVALLLVILYVCAELPFSSSQVGKTLRRPAAGHDPSVIPSLSATMRTSLQAADTVGLPWFDDMEGGGGQWTHDGFWRLAYLPQNLSVLSPAIDPDQVLFPDSGVLPPAFSGARLWWFGEELTGTYIGTDFDPAQAVLKGGTSAEPHTGSLVTPPISLIGHGRALLSFMTWWEIEAVNSHNFDLMQVEVSSDGGATWRPAGTGRLNPLQDPGAAPTVVYSSGGLGKKGAWIRQYFDLSSFGGLTILIRFRFDTVDGKYNGFRGWFIDDVSLKDTVAPAPAIAAVTPSVISETPFVDAGQVLTITGSSFVSGATVQVDSAPDTATVVSSTTIAFQPFLTMTLAVGPHDLRITNPDGQSVVVAGAFTVSADIPPVVNAVSPDSVPAGVSAQVTIDGNHFRAGLVVFFGANPVRQVQLRDSTEITVAFSPLPAPGSYDLRVMNPDGLSASFTPGFTVVASGIRVSVRGDSLQGSPQALIIVPPVAKVFASGVLYFRAGGMTLFDSLALTARNDSFSVVIPAGAVTIQGLEYYCRLHSANGDITYPAAAPDSSPAIFPVKVAALLLPLALAADQYRMISVPLRLEVPAVQTQMEGAYGPYNTRKWRVFRWEKGSYHEIPAVGAPLIPGIAFWLITHDGAPFSVQRGMSVLRGQQEDVPVDTGWNQIANPFAFPVSWSSVSLSGGSMKGPYRYPDGVQPQLDSSSALLPFEGYFVYVDPEFSPSFRVLSFRPVRASVSPVPKPDAPSSGLAPGEFVLQLSAQIPGTPSRDSYNYIGLRNGASTGRDRLDALKPPPIAGGIQLNVMEGGVPFLEDFKPPAGGGQSWTFGLWSDGMKAEAEMTLTPAGSLPEGYGLHILDLNNGDALPASVGTFAVNLDQSGTPRYFKVIMGTAEYAKRESGGIPLQPVSYALDQNYPNPFNPDTRIRYALARRGDARLVVFNTLGQRVRTLVSGIGEAGAFEVVWNGRNDAGRQAASGVYFYRLQAGDFVAVRKMLMIR